MLHPPPSLHSLYWHLPVQKMILQMKAFLVQLSWCICTEDVEFEGGTWRIVYFRRWSFCVDSPSILCADLQYILIARIKGGVIGSMCARHIAALPYMSKKSVNVTLVPHLPNVLYVVGSLQWNQRHHTLWWIAYTTVDWSMNLGEMCRSLNGRRWLQMDTVIMSVPTPFSQLTVEGQLGYMKCLWHFLAVSWFVLSCNRRVYFPSISGYARPLWLFSLSFLSW